MTNRAPSSSFVTNAWTYDVFLSFRGVDTRYGFTNNLHQALKRKGIRSFIDHEDLKVGEEISPALATAIEESRIGIIVFSKNYASSTFCLEELVEILKCIQGKGRLVLPIFYKVKPCNVRHQIKSYKDAFDKLKTRFGNDSDQIDKWKKALHNAANLKGEPFTKKKYEHAFIERIVQQVSRIINRTPLNLLVNCLVGWESQVQNIISLLDGESSEVKCMVGIWGIGGIGKSTIARVLFNLIADQFEGVCFLPDVKESSIADKGLVELQQKLLHQILEGETIEFIDLHGGSGIIKHRLQRKKVLLVLDDIDQKNQLQGLAGQLDWFGPGSRIIITTRDRHLLHVHGVEKIYEVKGLNDAEASELFCWNAFKKDKADLCYMNISMRAIHYCKGLPLALTIIGSNLFGKTIEECESALDVYERRNPDKDIQKLLKISYDGLQDHEKVIFLDIACFLKGYKLSDVMNILQSGRDSSPEYAVSVLVEKSLIKISRWECIDIVSMHDLIQEMGREIVRQESKSKPGERSRLWHYKDVLDVLQENKGTDKIEFIMLDLPEDEEVDWDGESFKLMKNLKVLVIKNGCFSVAPKYLPNSLRIFDWTAYPSSSLPQDFYPRDLVMLNLPNSVLAWNKLFQKFKLLTHMDFSNNRFLRQVPDISGLQNLRRLNLKGCINLIEVHDSIRHLDKIEILDVAGCSKLRIFPHSLKSRYLRCLNLSGCLTLPTFPEVVANTFSIHVSSANYPTSSFSNTGDHGMLSCSILSLSKFDKLIYESGEGPSKIKYLQVWNGCRIDEFLSTYMAWFATLEGLNVNDSSNLTDELLLSRLPWFPNLTFLDLSNLNFTILPACINQCCFLRRLELDGCRQLRQISGIPSSVKFLSAQDCTSLTPQSRSLLSSEKLHESGGTNFIFPGSRVPNWCHSYCRGSSLSFWFRKKLPLIACVFYVHAFYDIQMCVNGQEIKCEALSKFCCDSGDHVHLYDLQNKFEAVKNCINDGWNHVELKVNIKDDKVECIGVCEYKQNHDTKDVRFTSPTTISGIKRKRQSLDRVQNDGPNALRRNKKAQTSQHKLAGTSAMLLEVEQLSFAVRELVI